MVARVRSLEDVWSNSGILSEALYCFGSTVLGFEPRVIFVPLSMDWVMTRIREEHVAIILIMELNIISFSTNTIGFRR